MSTQLISGPPAYEEREGLYPLRREARTVVFPAGFTAHTIGDRGNHYLGKGTVKTIAITSILNGEQLKAPPGIVQRYPTLKDFAKNCSADRHFKGRWSEVKLWQRVCSRVVVSGCNFQMVNP